MIFQENLLLADDSHEIHVPYLIFFQKLKKISQKLLSAAHRDYPIEYTQHMFWLRNKKIFWFALLTEGLQWYVSLGIIMVVLGLILTLLNHILRSSTL